jgi:hypothetical protein
MQGVTAVAKETLAFAFISNIFNNCSNAGITSSLAVYRMITLPKHLLM